MRGIPVPREGPRAELQPFHSALQKGTWSSYGLQSPPVWDPAPGPHRNTARQVVDGLWTEVCGQQKQSNDPGNNQHILNTPIIGRR